jgi:hypothetical protein
MDIVADFSSIADAQQETLRIIFFFEGAGKIQHDALFFWKAAIAI